MRFKLWQSVQVGREWGVIVALHGHVKYFKERGYPRWPVPVGKPVPRGYIVVRFRDRFELVRTRDARIC